ncbi:MAG: NAD-dependent epimerase/dehydratase family protein [Verrucomicrobia bacterium]|nr:NAD-dependent epimerase/dehydratase family protein [Verrucomicrobiota bacterium]
MLKHNVKNSVIPKRVVVVGAGGFIGTALVKLLSKKSIPHLALTSNNLNLLDTGASNKLIDIIQPEDTLIVISAIAPCKDNQMLFKNISMMAAVCAAVEKSPPKHVIYISSDAVYADDVKPLTENSCAEPSSLHGVMHLAREVMLKQVCVTPLAILRPTLVYGPGDTHNGYGPNQFQRLAVEGKSITLFGGGEEQRDHVYIEDVVEILSLVITYKSSGVLNVATGSLTSFSDIAQMVAAQFKPSTIIKTVPRKVPMPHKGYRPFDITVCRNAFPNFGYLPLKEGLKRMNREIMGK